MKNKKGITLIVLIVTIIIILLLAGITLSTIFRRKWNNRKCKKCSKRIWKGTGRGWKCDKRI